MSGFAVLAIVLAYAFVGLLFACRLATLLAWWFRDRAAERYSTIKQQAEPDGEQWFGAALVALPAAAIWPVVAVGFIARGRLFRPPSRVVERQQAERIAELEKELEL